MDTLTDTLKTLIESSLAQLKLQPGEYIDTYKDGQTGKGGSVGVNKLGYKKHFSVSGQRMGILVKKDAEGNLTDQYGKSLKGIAKDFDLERTRPSLLKYTPGEPTKIAGKPTGQKTKKTGAIHGKA